MFSDYKRIVAESGFSTIFLKGYDVPTMQARYLAATKPGHFDQLNFRYPKDRDGFLYDGITMLLRK